MKILKNNSKIKNINIENLKLDKNVKIYNPGNIYNYFINDNLFVWPFVEIQGHVKIGKNILIGSNATILPIKICSNTFIGAEAVVTKNIIKKGIYTGNPAKL